MHRQRPSLSHLNDFGSAVLYRVDDQLRRKLDPEPRKGVLVGYSANKARYRIWDRELHRLIDVRLQVAHEDIVKKQNFDGRYVSKEKQSHIWLILQAVDDPGPRMAEVTIDAGPGKPSKRGDQDGHPEHATQEGYQMKSSHNNEPGAGSTPELTPSPANNKRAPGDAEGEETNDKLDAPAGQARVSFDLEDAASISDDEEGSPDQNNSAGTDDIIEQEVHPVSVPENIPDESVRRGTRIRMPTKGLEYDTLGKPHWGSSAGLTVAQKPEPKTYWEVMHNPEKDQWLKAMDKEE